VRVLRSSPRLRATQELATALVLSLTLVAGTGLVAVGASGILSAAFGGVWGREFVAGDPPDVTYTPARCADLQEYHSEAPDCRAAAAAHHFDEVVEYRLAAGILGLLALGVWVLVRRRFPGLVRPGVLPEGFTATVGASLFGMASILMLGSSLGNLAFGQPGGAGQWLSGGIVSLVAFAAYAVALLRVLYRRLAWGSGVRG
jgi:hypothetical protein